LNYLPGLASNQDPPDLSLPSSWLTGMSHQCLTGRCFSIGREIT
jgi:hypothetical protein